MARFIARCDRVIQSEAVDSLGSPVSRLRCGGRRGGLNDSQHCAVGPGLQSPQRWSFPPASISLRRLPPLVAQQQQSPPPPQQQQQLLSLHPSVSPSARCESSIFLPRCPCSSSLSTTGTTLWKVPPAEDVNPPGPSFVQFAQVAESYTRTTKWRQLHSRINSVLIDALA